MNDCNLKLITLHVDVDVATIVCISVKATQAITYNKI